MTRLAIRTDNFRLSYKLIDKLRAKSLNFEILDINSPVPDDSIVWFSAPSEIIDFPSIGTPIPVEVETIDQALLSALHQIKGNNASISLTIGIDPGPYPGIAWLVDGAFCGIMKGSRSSIRTRFYPCDCLHEVVNVINNNADVRFLS